MRLGFGQIERAMQDIHAVDAEKMTAFRARLRYLQQRVDIGIPRGGVGRRANFTVGHALLFGLALELEQFGMTPEHVAEAIAALGTGPEMGTLREAVYEAASRAGLDRPAVLLWFAPEALRDATRNVARAQRLNIPDLALMTISWSEASQIPAGFLSTQDGFQRLAIVNLSALIHCLVEALGGDPAEYSHALIAWANDEEDE